MGTLPAGRPDCRHCGIRDRSLFARLDAAETERVHDAIHDVRVAAHSRVFTEGERGRCVYTLRNGLVKLVRYLPDGTQRIVRLLKTGDTLGLEATDEAPYESTAIALVDVALCRIPIEVVDALRRDSPHLHAQLVRKWHEAVRNAETFIAELGSGSARRRLARLLLMLADPAQDCAMLPAREDVGAMLGLTTETSSRAVAAFRRESLIEPLDRVGRVFRLDRARLEAVASHLD